MSTIDDEGKRLLDSMSDDELRTWALKAARQRGLLRTVAIHMHPDYLETLKKTIPTIKTAPQMDDPRNVPIVVDDTADPHDPIVVERAYDGHLYVTPLSKWEDPE